MSLKNKRYCVEFSWGSWRGYAHADSVSEALYYLERARFPAHLKHSSAYESRGKILRCDRRIYDSEDSSVVEEIKGMNYWKSIICQIFY